MMEVWLCPEHDAQIKPVSREPYFGWKCERGHTLLHKQRRRMQTVPFPEECIGCGEPADLTLPGLLVMCADCHADHPQWRNA